MDRLIEKLNDAKATSPTETTYDHLHKILTDPKTDSEILDETVEKFHMLGPTIFEDVSMHKNTSIKAHRTIVTKAHSHLKNIGKNSDAGMSLQRAIDNSKQM